MTNNTEEELKKKMGNSGVGKNSFLKMDGQKNILIVIKP